MELFYVSVQKGMENVLDFTYITWGIPFPFFRIELCYVSVQKGNLCRRELKFDLCDIRYLFTAVGFLPRAAAGGLVHKWKRNSYIYKKRNNI